MKRYLCREQPMSSTRWHHSKQFSVDEFKVDILVVRIMRQFPDIIHIK